MDELENSLGGGATYAGTGRPPSSAEMSLGDEGTLGDKHGDQETVIDDIEVVDLEARYKVEGTLGRGGMGEVLLALDTRLDRKVAIKRILGEAARSKTAISRFITEAKAIAALNHPNIVQIYDYGRAKDGPFLIMEYVDGSSLLDRCREGALPVEEAIDLACQLCDGLAKAHDLGIVHRDIKPANVLLTTGGVPKLTDFGLAKAETSDQQMTMTGAVLGTPDFMPPEQRRDASLVDARSDLWSLAATLYQMVTGRSPKIIRFDLLPASLTSVLGTALEDSKDDRFQTAREFSDAIKSAQTIAEPTAKLTAVSGTLQEGQCKACGTVTSDLSRKYCRNGSCGASLRVDCLKCKAAIPVWDEVCGECGENQAALLQARRDQYEQSRSKAEQSLGELAFEDAVRLAAGVAEETHADLADLKEWATEFIASATAEREHQLAAFAEHLKEARLHLAAFDYAAAIHTLESIAEPLRSNEVRELSLLAHQRQDEAAELLQQIRAQIKEKTLGGLIPKVTRAIEVCGERDDLEKLLGQLCERRDAKLARAKAAFLKGQSRQAAKHAAEIDQHDLDTRGREYVAEVQAAGQLEEKLAATVKEAKADGEISQAEAISILGLADELLKLNPHAVDVQRIAEQCKRIIHNQPPLVNSVGIELKLIPAGTFTMGDAEGEYFATPHEVTLTQPFFLGVTPVTNKQWKAVMSSAPSKWRGANRPVEQVSWEDAVAFCKKLSAMPDERAAGREYRLPTEAEWEYACRAGSTTQYSFGDDETLLGDFGWFDGNANRQTRPVGQKRPNAWGLYDMLGNVWEWCSDLFGVYPDGAATDPRGPSTGSDRVFRGGCWFNAAGDCRSADRRWYSSSYRDCNLGFRLALSPPGAKPPEVGK